MMRVAFLFLALGVEVCAMGMLHAAAQDTAAAIPEPSGSSPNPGDDLTRAPALLTVQVVPVDLSLHVVARAAEPLDVERSPQARSDAPESASTKPHQRSAGEGISPSALHIRWCRRCHPCTVQQGGRPAPATECGALRATECDALRATGCGRNTIGKNDASTVNGRADQA